MRLKFSSMTSNEEHLKYFMSSNSNKNNNLNTTFGTTKYL